MCGEHEHCENDKCMCGQERCEEAHECGENPEGEKECKGNNCLSKIKLILSEYERKINPSVMCGEERCEEVHECEENHEGEKECKGNSSLS